MTFKLPSIYPITDTRLAGISHVEQVNRLISGGATLIQIREKLASPREFFEAALPAVSLAHEKNARIIINDRVDIALAVCADGVHLGQDDLSPVHARRILGPNAIIGFSTHTLEQAVEAITLAVDYIAFGPVFPTRTKEDHDEVVGLAGVREVSGKVGDFPLVVIGGINGDNVASVFEAGADSAAIIGGSTLQAFGNQSMLQESLSIETVLMVNTVYPFKIMLA